MGSSKRMAKDIRALRHSGIVLSRAAIHAQARPTRNIGGAILAATGLLCAAGVGIWAITRDGTQPAQQQVAATNLTQDTSSNNLIETGGDVTRAVSDPGTAPLPQGIQPDNSAAATLAMAVAASQTAPALAPVALAPVAMAPVAPSCTQTVLEQAAQTVLEFPVGATALPAADLPRLLEFAQMVQDCDSVRVTIAGHTDPSGIDSINLELSWIRATYVQTMVEQAGFDSKRYQAVGFGSSQPVLDNTGAVLADQSRRVDFIVTPNPT